MMSFNGCALCGSVAASTAAISSANRKLALSLTANLNLLDGANQNEEDASIESKN
jgi:hypothetical protein